jgi:hypothetical protein
MNADDSNTHLAVELVEFLLSVALIRVDELGAPEIVADSMGTTPAPLNVCMRFRQQRLILT